MSQHSIDIEIRKRPDIGRRIVAELKRNGNFHTLVVDGSLSPPQLREVLEQQMRFVISRVVDEYIKEQSHGH